MIKMAKWILAQWVMVVVCLVSASVVRGASQEIRPPSELSGTIAAPMEERKQALSSGDKIFVSLDTALPVKKGDKLEMSDRAETMIQDVMDNVRADKYPLPSYAHIGERGVLRLDGYEKATGKATYTMDIRLPGRNARYFVRCGPTIQLQKELT